MKKFTDYTTMKRKKDSSLNNAREFKKRSQIKRTLTQISNIKSELSAKELYKLKEQLTHEYCKRFLETNNQRLRKDIETSMKKE